MILINEQIGASEVQLTGIHGEDLGVVSKVEALAMARKLKLDLVCTSIFSSPPLCKLMGRGTAKQAIAKKQKRDQGQPAKVKEMRLTVHIEDHDYETKLRQAEKLLTAGNAVQFVVRIQGKEGPQAKELLERLLKDLAECGKKETGIQLSGKQATIKVDPI
ncbi:MAG: translation initiation factor IF-3 [Candidatus Cohnella colombiensis]|uniref:Translation initiation factor IF-3 n=1 Tax=Candidatus Cohnella colombiensis TaxID=3121368 RepID=A0AA95F4N0_9BACL|nr:MAG: translation initiation factor IF-3 [Cohnella sp.]